MNYLVQCIGCRKPYPGDEVRYRCDCGEILEVTRTDWDGLKKTISRELYDSRLGSLDAPYNSGIWRFKELVLPLDDHNIVSKPEGNTNLYHAGSRITDGQSRIGSYVDVDVLYLKHEGENPSGSFKDRGMSVAVSHAASLGMNAVACASTGNTSSSLGCYAAKAGMKGFVFLPKGKISASKLAQSIGYGAYVIQINGDFDTAMKLVEKVCLEHKIYLVNSINPYRIEGQKSIAYELLQQLKWDAPDWVIVPGGNLGNTSAIGKGLLELKELGFISRVPRIAVTQATGANPFYLSFIDDFKTFHPVKAETIASAIRIGNPVSFVRGKHIIQSTQGVVEEVSDEEILAAKQVIDRSGIGCEPASATTVAGLKKLRKKNIIRSSEKVVCILTGHILKDPDTVMKYHTQSVIETTEKTLSHTIRHLLD